MRWISSSLPRITRAMLSLIVREQLGERLGAVGLGGRPRRIIATRPRRSDRERVDPPMRRVARGRHRRHQAGRRRGRRRRGDCSSTGGSRRPAASRRRGDLGGAGRRPGRRARRAGTDAAAVGVGCGGPMSAGGETVSPLNIAGVAGLPAAGPAGRAVRAADLRRQRRQGAGPGRGLGRARRPACDDYMAMVVSTGVGGGIVVGGRLLDGAGGNAGHIGHVIVEPDGRPCACGGAGLPRGRGVGHRRSRRSPAAAPADAPAERRAAHRAPGRSGRGVGGQPAGPAAGGRGRLGGARATATTSSTPPRPSSTDRPALDFARGAPHRGRRGAAPTARSIGAAAVGSPGFGGRRKLPRR